MTATRTENRDGAQVMAKLLASISDPRQMRRFMDEILTSAEIRDLVLRWRLLQRLHAGEPQRSIADDLGVSLCKITRGSRILKQPGSVTAAILDAQTRGHDRAEPAMKP